ncbi:hypothetical protein VTO58DRAFT_109024 [Aureobasidium pullulans]
MANVDRRINHWELQSSSDSYATPPDSRSTCDIVLRLNVYLLWSLHRGTSHASLALGTSPLNTASSSASIRMDQKLVWIQP